MSTALLRKKRVISFILMFALVFSMAAPVYGAPSAYDAGPNISVNEEAILDPGNYPNDLTPELDDEANLTPDEALSEDEPLDAEYTGDSSVQGSSDFDEGELQLLPILTNHYEADAELTLDGDLQQEIANFTSNNLLANGTFTAVSRGYHNATPLTVQIVIAQGSVASVTVTHHAENTLRGSAVELTELDRVDFFARFTGLSTVQGVNTVDGVSRATVSANAVRSAVLDALGQSMIANLGDSSDFTTESWSAVTSAKQAHSNAQALARETGRGTVSNTNAVNAAMTSAVNGLASAIGALEVSDEEVLISNAFAAMNTAMADLTSGLATAEVARLAAATAVDELRDALEANADIEELAARVLAAQDSISAAILAVNAASASAQSVVNNAQVIVGLAPTDSRAIDARNLVEGEDFASAIEDITLIGEDLRSLIEDIKYLAGDLQIPGAGTPPGNGNQVDSGGWDFLQLRIPTAFATLLNSSGAGVNGTMILADGERVNMRRSAASGTDQAAITFNAIDFTEANPVRIAPLVSPNNWVLFSVTIDGTETFFRMTGTTHGGGGGGIGNRITVTGFTQLGEAGPGTPNLDFDDIDVVDTGDFDLADLTTGLASLQRLLNQVTAAGDVASNEYGRVTSSASAANVATSNVANGMTTANEELAGVPAAITAAEQATAAITSANLPDAEYAINEAITAFNEAFAAVQAVANHLDDVVTHSNRATSAAAEAVARAHIAIDRALAANEVYLDLTQTLTDEQQAAEDAFTTALNAFIEAQTAALEAADGTSIARAQAAKNTAAELHADWVVSAQALAGALAGSNYEEAFGLRLLALQRALDARNVAIDAVIAAYPLEVVAQTAIGIEGNALAQLQQQLEEKRTALLAVIASADSQLDGISPPDSTVFLGNGTNVVVPPATSINVSGIEFTSATTNGFLIDNINANGINSFNLVLNDGEVITLNRDPGNQNRFLRTGGTFPLSGVSTNAGGANSWVLVALSINGETVHYRLNLSGFSSNRLQVPPGQGEFIPVAPTTPGAGTLAPGVTTAASAIEFSTAGNNFLTQVLNTNQITTINLVLANEETIPLSRTATSGTGTAALRFVHTGGNFHLTGISGSAPNNQILISFDLNGTEARYLLTTTGMAAASGVNRWMIPDQPGPIDPVPPTTPGAGLRLDAAAMQVNGLSFTGTNNFLAMLTDRGISTINLIPEVGAPIPLTRTAGNSVNFDAATPQGLMGITTNAGGANSWVLVEIPGTGELFRLTVNGTGSNRLNIPTQAGGPLTPLTGTDLGLGVRAPSATSVIHALEFTAASNNFLLGPLADITTIELVLEDGERIPATRTTTTGTGDGFRRFIFPGGTNRNLTGVVNSMILIAVEIDGDEYFFELSATTVSSNRLQLPAQHSASLLPVIPAPTAGVGQVFPTATTSIAGIDFTGTNNVLALLNERGADSIHVVFSQGEAVELTRVAGTPSRFVANSNFFITDISTANNNANAWVMLRIPGNSFEYHRVSISGVSSSRLQVPNQAGAVTALDVSIPGNGSQVAGPTVAASAIEFSAATNNFLVNVLNANSVTSVDLVLADGATIPLSRTATSGSGTGTVRLTHAGGNFHLTGIAPNNILLLAFDVNGERRYYQVTTTGVATASGVGRWMVPQQLGTIQPAPPSTAGTGTQFAAAAFGASALEFSAASNNFLVNVLNANGVTNMNIVLANGETIPLSRTAVTGSGTGAIRFTHAAGNFNLMGITGSAPNNRLLVSFEIDGEQTFYHLTTSGTAVSSGVTRWMIPVQSGTMLPYEGAQVSNRYEMDLLPIATLEGEGTPGDQTRFTSLDDSILARMNWTTLDEIFVIAPLSSSVPDSGPGDDGGGGDTTGPGDGGGDTTGPGDDSGSGGDDTTGPQETPGGSQPGAGGGADSDADGNNNAGDDGTADVQSTPDDDSDAAGTGEGTGNNQESTTGGTSASVGPKTGDSNDSLFHLQTAILAALLAAFAAAGLHKKPARHTRRAVANRTR